MSYLQETRLWFAESGDAFVGAEPAYFNPGEFPWVSEIEANWEIIRDEFAALLKEHSTQLRPYANESMTSSDPSSWRTFTMMFWYRRNRANCQRCPKTWAMLQSIPGLCAASFNLLEPNTTIKPHFGDTNAIVRCHMGLEIPAPAPQCGFKVRDEVRSWEPGRFLMFCDAHQHSAWNNSAQRRYIMVLDVMRPQFAQQSRAIASRVQASVSYGVALQRSPWLRKHCRSGLGRAVLFRLLQWRYRLQLATQR